MRPLALLAIGIVVCLAPARALQIETKSPATEATAPTPGASNCNFWYSRGMQPFDSEQRRWLDLFLAHCPGDARFPAVRRRLEDLTRPRPTSSARPRPRPQSDRFVVCPGNPRCPRRNQGENQPQLPDQD